ncbi:MAG: hypothetical protein K2X50_02850 [Gammaproteobacteria bacterium]|nr:hypothetical protein [Gammaproteobacteria bacterium]
MRKAQLPDEFPQDTPLSTFKGNPSYTMIYTVEDHHVQPKVIKLTAEIHLFIKNIYEKIAVIKRQLNESQRGDLDYFRAALAIVDLMALYSENIKLHYRVGADLISIVVMLMYKFSESVKNRNKEIIHDAGWPLFDILAFLTFAHENHNGGTPHFVLQQMLQPKMIDEITGQIRSVLQQIYDTESRIQAANSDAPLHPTFLAHPALLQDILILQKVIDAGIQQDEDVSVKANELRESIKQHQLKANIVHIHFFCITVNSYYSLQKILLFIKEAQCIPDLSSPESQSAFLQCLVLIGEYMSHRRLCNKFRDFYPALSWETYQVIRDCLQHPEENDNEHIYRLLIQAKLSDDITLNNLQSELSELGNAITAVIEREYKNPSQSFYNRYLAQYAAEQETERYSFTEDEKQLFLRNIKDDAQPNLKDIWRNILQGSDKLPEDTKKLGQLKATLKKPDDLNKDIRCKCENIISNRLDDIEYLNIHLDISLLNDRPIERIKEKLKEILNINREKEISNNDKAFLRRLLPSVNYGDKQEEYNACCIILDKIVDLNNKGSNILYPRQYKVFRQCALFLSDESRWSMLLTKATVLPTVDEYINLCSCLKEAKSKNLVVNVMFDCFSVQIVDIYEIIHNNLLGRLNLNWLRVMPSEDLSVFRQILDKNPLLSIRWLKILSKEISYPDHKTYCDDLNIIKSTCSSDIKEFVRISTLLKPISAKIPAAVKLQQMFQSPREPRRISKLQKIEIAIQQLRVIQSFARQRIYDQKFTESIVQGIFSTVNAQLDFERAINPTYQRFLMKRERIYQETALEAKRTGKPIAMPLKRIEALYNDTVVEDPRERDSRERMFKSSDKTIRQAYNDQPGKVLPEIVDHDPAFKRAAEFHLTRGLSLLKSIIKSVDLSIAPMLRKNYLVIKKARNDIVHGDYVRESLGKNLNDILIELIKSIEYILNDLETIKKTNLLVPKYTHLSQNSLHSFFGGINAKLPRIILSKIFSYLYHNEFKYVVPLVCKIWRDTHYSEVYKSTLKLK